MKSTKYFALTSGALTVVMGIVGCGSSEAPAAHTPADAATIQAQAIENNPNMPQDQKDQVLARIKGQSAMADALTKQSKR